MANILLIEDNHHNQNVFTTTLTHHQHRVTLAGDGEQAIEILESMVPDLIILDLSLPRIDGWTVAKTIRTSPSEALAKVPIIAVTAHAMKGDKQRAIEAGCDEYLSKPISPRELARNVAAVLRARSS